MEKMVQCELLPGIYLRCIQTDRFRSGTFSAGFLRPLKQAEAAKNALLMPVLSRGCRAFPDMQRLRIACQEAYGAEIEPELRQYGETLSIGFRATFVDDRWLPEDKGNLERVIRLVSDLCLDPCTRGGLLRDEYVRSERQHLRDRIRSAVNDKRSYAQLRARALLCPEEDYGVYPLGRAEDAEKLSHLIMTRHHQQVLAASPVRLFYCGTAAFEQVRAAVLGAFQMLPGSSERLMPQTEIRDNAAVLRTETEYVDAQQGNLVLACRLGGAVSPRQQPVLEVFNRLYGGGSPASLLFREVRERRSLCYSVSSAYDRHKAVFTVQAGIDPDRRDDVTELILAQLDRVRLGAFDPLDLETARSAAANAFRVIGDSGDSLDGFYLGQELMESDARPEELAALAAEVRAEDVARMAERVQPELLYLLRGGSQEAQE